MSLSLPLNGPAWLSELGEPEEQPHRTLALDECLQEMKTPKVLALFTSELQPTEPISECKDYSSLQRLLRVTALAFKFVHILKSRAVAPI